MIATARIAPYERWCEYFLRHPKRGTALMRPGNEIEIISESCLIDPPGMELVFFLLGHTQGHPQGTRWWMLSERFVQATGGDPRRRWVCEHLLEMD